MTILVEESTNQADKYHWTENKGKNHYGKKRCSVFKPPIFGVCSCDVNEVNVFERLRFRCPRFYDRAPFSDASTLDSVFK